jgi:hypothetical protein
MREKLMKKTNSKTALAPTTMPQVKSMRVSSKMILSTVMENTGFWEVVIAIIILVMNYNIYLNNK